MTEDELYLIVDSVAASGRGSMLRNVSETDFEKVLKYRNENFHSGLRLFWYFDPTEAQPGVLHVKGITPVHGMISAGATLDIGEINQLASGSIRGPIVPRGDTAIRYDNVYCEPDNAFIVKNRQDTSPNVVLETQYLNNATHQDVYNKSGRYITETDDILSVIVYTCWRGGAMFVYELRRVLGTRTFTSHHFISFGRVAMHPNATNALALVFPGIQFVGVGFMDTTVVPAVPYPACNGLGIPVYQMPVPQASLFSLDNNGNVLYQPPAGFALQPFYDIDLYFVQERANL